MAFWTREVFETYEKQAPFRAELTRFIDGMTDRVAISGKWLAPQIQFPSTQTVGIHLDSNKTMISFSLVEHASRRVPVVSELGARLAGRSPSHIRGRMLMK